MERVNINHVKQHINSTQTHNKLINVCTLTGEIKETDFSINEHQVRKIEHNKNSFSFFQITKKAPNLFILLKVSLIKSCLKRLHAEETTAEAYEILQIFDTSQSADFKEFQNFVDEHFYTFL